MKPLTPWWRPWWSPPFQIPNLPVVVAFALVFAGFLISRSSCPRGVEAFGNQGLRALPAGFSGATESPPDLAKGPGSRSLLSTLPEIGKHETAVVAFLDGTIYFVDGTSGRIYGSFSSGSPLSTSYHVLPDHYSDTDSGPEVGEKAGSYSLRPDNYFISCGDDWTLYEHSKEFGKRRVEMTIEEFVEGAPRVSVDGGITLGSKRSTMYLVDANSGKIISSHWPSTIHQEEVDKPEDKLALPRVHKTWVESSPAAIPPILITRTDYSLNHFVNSSKPVWGLTVSIVKASSCEGFRNNLSPMSGYELGLEYQGAIKQCTEVVPVHQIHGIDPIKIGLVPSTKISLPESQNLPALIHSPPTNLISNLPEHEIDSSRIKDINKFSGAHLDVTQRSLSEAHNSPKANISRGAIVHVEQVEPEVIHRSFVWYLILPIFAILLLCYTKVNTRFRTGKQPKKFEKSAVSKKRKSRKGANGNSPATKGGSSGEYEEVLANASMRGNDDLVSFPSPGENSENRCIGKLFLSNIEIAKGSNGTIVLEGFYGGRPVAVKRLVRAHHDVAIKEIENLIASDQHPNIVRWFGVEKDQDFVYISLERCACSLNDLIHHYSDSPDSVTSAESLVLGYSAEYKVRLDFTDDDVELWKPNGCPSPQLLMIMRDVVSGLAHLHELGIVHRDIKPQNVLISKNRCLSAKLSDMGISKRLPKDMSSLGHHATGYGSSGWQAPEQLLHGRQTRAVDMFSLGCVLFFCITKGRHPFGNYFERDSNIVNNRMDLFLVDHIPEAVHLFSLLLDPNPERRPKALEVLQHPLFWSSEMRLSFLRDASDRVEMEDRENESELLKALESIGPVAFGGKWGDKIDGPLISDLGRYRKYRFDCTRDLLRVIRNKLNHYRELSVELQELLGSVPEGFDHYFSIKFPKLPIEVYKVMHRHCREDDSFRKYFVGTLH